MSKTEPKNRRFGRRRLLEGGALLGAAALLERTSLLPAAARRSVSDGLRLGSDMYQSISVRPLINCKGTFTIISGSLTLPEVKQAMEEAGRNFVHLDELMEAVGRRLGELSGAEWGIVTAGCSAAETLATCACIAGTNPEWMQRIPNDLEGLKNEVIIPEHSRNVYDHGVRMTGVQMITVKNLEELEDAINSRTAMIYVLANEPDDTGPFGLEPISRIGRAHGIPVFVDAAAEDYDPQVHLKRGADLVAYSGGKALRGPQCAGLLVGRKDLCQAAWLNSAPHHAYGRSLKVGKEEIMGMLAAVEMWHKRDHEAEWKQERSWLETIARKVGSIAGVKTEILPPKGRSNQSLQLQVEWDGSRLGISGQDVYDLMLDGTPRIILARAQGTHRQGLEKSSVSLLAWMMQPGDDAVVAQRLHDLLKNPPQLKRPAKPAGPPADIAGEWVADLQFSLGSARHTLFFEQDGEQLIGTHQSDLLSGRLQGWIEGNQVDFQSAQPYEGTRLPFHFRGSLSSGTLSGDVDLGEYGQAHWTATRRWGRT